LAAGWGALAREIAKGSLRTVRTMYQDVFVLNRRRGLPYQVTRCAASPALQGGEG
jgi:hypothetical protein